MSDNSEPNPTQTEVTSSEQLVGLVPIEGEEHGIGVQLLSGETDEDFFGAQAIELNGERHVIVSQAQDPETGELLLVLRGENGEHIAIQSEALSSMVQASGGEHIQVAVESSEEASLTLASDMSTLSQSVSITESNTLPTTSLSALPSIIANIPNSQTLTTTAPTNVVQAIETPRVSQEEQPSSLTNMAAVTPSVPQESDQTNEQKIRTESIQKEEVVIDKHLPNAEQKTHKSEESIITSKVTKEVKVEDKQQIKEKESVVSQPKPEVKEMDALKEPVIPEQQQETAAPTVDQKASIETKAVTESTDNSITNKTVSNEKTKELKATETLNNSNSANNLNPTPAPQQSPPVPTILSDVITTSGQTTTSSETQSTTDSTPISTTESNVPISPTTIAVSEEKVTTNTTESVNSVPDMGFGNTAVIQVQDSGNDTSIEQLMANAVLTSDGNYVLMAQTEDGQVTGLPPELNLSDVINAGAAGGQTFLIETPEGLVACTASTSGEDGSIQLIPTEAADIENAVISSAQSTGTSVESQIIQAISGGQPMSYTFNSNSGCLELTAVNSNQTQPTTQKASRGGRGSRSNKSKTVSSVPSMGQTLLLTSETETTGIASKPVPTSRSRGSGGRGKGSRISGVNDSSDLGIASNAQQSKPKTLNEVKLGITGVNSLSSATSAPPGPSQLAASRRTYSKKSNIVWITPDASQGANNTTFATVATASVKPSVQKQKTIPNCNSSVSKTTDETTASSRVRTPSPTKTTSLTPTTLSTKTTALTSIRSTSPTKTTIPTTIQSSTVTKPDTKTSSNKPMVTTIANKSSTQTVEKKDMSTTKTVTASKTTALKTPPSRGQTPNLTIQTQVKPTETTKTTIRVSDITATKTSVETSPKTISKTVVTVPSPTKTKVSVTKSGALTTTPSTTSTVKPIAPTKPISQSQSKKLTPITTTVESSISSTKKPITTTSSTKPTPNTVRTEDKAIKSSETGTPFKESIVSSKQQKTESTHKKVVTPVAVKSTVSLSVNSSKNAINSTEKSTKKSAEKISSNTSVGTRHSSRLSPTKHLKSETNTKTETKLPLISSDLIESKVKSSKTILITEDSKKKSETEQKNKNESEIPKTDTSSQKTLKTEETAQKSEAELQSTESINEENKSKRKSRRSSRNTTNVEENKKEVITEENKTIETKTKEIKDKTIKEKAKESPIESMSSRRSSRKKEVTLDDKPEELSAVSSTAETTNLVSVSTPTNEGTPQRRTRASIGKNPEVKPYEEMVSKISESKDSKEKDTETKVESEVKDDFDRIVKESTPSVEKTTEKTDSIPLKTTETPSLSRSIKKKVQFEIKEKSEEKVSKGSDSDSTPTAPKRRSLRSSTPQVNQSSTDVQSSPEKKVSDNETQNDNNERTPQRFSTRKRKEVTKPVETEVKEMAKSPKKHKKSETNAIESAINDKKNIDSTHTLGVSRLRDRRTPNKTVRRPEPRNSIRDTFRHSIEMSDPMSRINRRQSLIHSFIDEKEWKQKEEETRRKTISSLSDLRSPNECYDYSTNECRFYIRHQSASLTPKQSTGNYLCQKCGFHTTRINNLVIHHRDQCSYVKNQVIQHWQTELQKRVRPSDTSLTASTSSPEKRRKTNEDLNNICDKITDQSEDDSEDEEITKNSGKSNQNPTISDIDAMLMGSDDEDLLSLDNIEKPKREFGFSEDDIVWVETNGTHWPALVSKVFTREKKALIRLIDSPSTKKSLKADISSISLFDSAEVNKQYLRDGRKGSNGDLLVKAVQKAEEFLRKKCLGNELSAAKFFDQIDSDLSEANADEDERLSLNTKDNVSVDSKETPKTSNDLSVDNNIAVIGSNGDSEVDKMPESNEAIAQWKEKRRQQNAKLLQCIKEGKVETHLVGVYRESIASERHQKFKSGSESEKNQLKHVPWFGPIDDEEQQEEIYDYCSQLFKSNFKTDGSFDTVAYIFEVWVPEAIVKAISRVRRIELKESESIFAKGVILSKSEKDELTKEIQKEAEKQMTSQTSSD